MPLEILRTPYPGLVLMLGGIAWNAVSNAWPPTAVALGGAAWAIGALWFENWHLKRAREPKLSLTFDHETGSPFIRNKPIRNKNINGVRRILSVGVLNSGSTVDGVAVKLMRIEPAQHSERWAMSLLVHDSKAGTATATIHRATKIPIVYYDLLAQDIFDGEVARPPMLRFADEGLINKLQLNPQQERYFVTLAINGPGALEPTRFVLQRERGVYEMRHAS
jgi:hypothetical protein